MRPELRIGRRKIVAVILAVLIAVAGIAAWSIGGTDSLLIVVLGTLVVGLGGIGYLVAISERRLRTDVVQQVSARVDSGLSALDKEIASIRLREGEQSEALLRTINAAAIRLQSEQDRQLTEFRNDIESLTEKQTKEVTRYLGAANRVQTEALERAIRRHDKQTADLLSRINQRMNRQFKHSTAELDAMMQVHRRASLDDPLPLMGGWALSPRGMLQAMELAGAPDVSLVVECGSGTSTLFLARTLQLRSTGRLIALEHLPEFAEQTQLALEKHGLDEIAEVRYAPLEEVVIDESSYMWYSQSSIADLDSIDLLVVDGPPESTGTWARYPAYPLLRGALSASGAIFVDDVQRSDERTMVDAWVQHGGLVESHALSPDQAILRHSLPQ